MTKTFCVVSLLILFGTAAADAGEELCPKAKITVSVDSTDISGLSQMGLMRAFNEIGKGNVDCIVLKRQGKILGIRYRLNH